ncbi:hypothetical protein K4L44_06280 [Halosquirtibacter laminarini]|uniref:Uncharacterized protein n=1 Tax=Halosquirtibacter laminarini TaxID=3374600 RepID=A0AC61NM71_9BACT|nr:hypothetical protein K4L44_06280 [Prolixibacteraceae bacterium]
MQGSQEEKDKYLQGMFMAVHGIMMSPQIYYGRAYKDFLCLFQNTSTKNKVKLGFLIYRDSLLQTFILENNEFTQTEEQLAFKTLELDKTDSQTLNMNGIVLKGERYQYYRALEYAFRLDFSKLKDTIDQWGTIDQWDTITEPYILKKASLWGLFDLNKSEVRLFLKNRLEHSTHENIQERVYILELYRFFLPFNADQNERDNINDEILTLKSEGLQSIYDNPNYLMKKLDQVGHTHTKVRSYGNDRDRITIFSSRSGFTHAGLGVQYILTLIESGLLASFGSNEQKVYQLLKEVIETYPFPVLFYILQNPNEGFLLRMAQDYCFADIGEKERKRIMTNLLQAIQDKNTPDLIRQNILMFVSKFIEVVPLDVYEDPISNILVKGEHNLYERAVSRIGRQEKAFVRSVMHYIEDEGVIGSYIDHLLALFLVKNLDSSDRTRVINLLYALVNSVDLEPLREKLELTNKDLLDSIDKKLDPIVQSDGEQRLLVIGNLYTFLSTNQIEKAKSEIKKIQFSEVKNTGVWPLILEFSDSKEARDKIKDGIVDNKMLFHSGLTKKDKGYGFSYVDFIPISSLTYPKGKKSLPLRWNEDQKKKILKKIQDEFELVHDFLGQDIRFMNHNSMFPLLIEMVTFLEHEKRYFESGNLKETYAKLYQEVRSEIETINPSYYSEEKLAIYLSSENIEDFRLGLNSLDRKVNRELSVSGLNEMFRILMEKILYPDAVTFEEALRFVARTWSSNNIRKKQKGRNPMIVRILKKYMPKDASDFNELLKEKEYDVAFAMKYLTMLAQYLWKLVEEDTSKNPKEKEEVEIGNYIIEGMSSSDIETVREWIRKAQSSRFVEVQNLVKSCNTEL